MANVAMCEVNFMRGKQKEKKRRRLAAVRMVTPTLERKMLAGEVDAAQNTFVASSLPGLFFSFGGERERE